MVIECNANAKLGSEVIENAPNHQSPNGNLLWSLVVMNSLETCEGTITRHRITKVSEEKAILDYFIVCETMEKFVEKMIVDEDRVDVLTKYANKKGTGKKVVSDHNLLVSKFDIQYNKMMNNPRIEVFDFKNPEAQKLFFKETSGVTLVNCFDDAKTVSRMLKYFRKLTRNFSASVLRKYVLKNSVLVR